MGGAHRIGPSREAQRLADVTLPDPVELDDGTRGSAGQLFPGRGFLPRPP